MPKYAYKKEEDVRRESVVIVVNAAEKEKIASEAQKMGLTMSTYCRFRVLADKEDEN